MIRPATSLSRQRAALRALRGRTVDWRDARAVGATIVSCLDPEFPTARISVFRIDSQQGTSEMLAMSSRGGPYLQGRSALERDPLVVRAIKDGEIQRYAAEEGLAETLPGGRVPVASELIVPVVSPTGTWGFVLLEHPAADGFSGEDELVVEAVTTQVALALPAAHLPTTGDEEIERLRRRVREVSAICALSEHFARAGTLSPILQRVAEGAAELMDCEMSTLLLQHPHSPQLEIVAACGVPYPAVGDLIPVEGSISGWVYRHGVHRATTSSALSPDWYHPSATRAGIRDTLIVPLRAADEVFGVLSVSNRRAEGGYTPEDVQLLSTLANQAAAAIEWGRMTDVLRRRLAESQAVAQVGRAVTSTRALDSVLDLVVREAEALVSAACASVTLATDADRMRVAVATGALSDNQGDVLPMEGSLLGWVARTGEEVVTACITDDPRVRPHEKRFGPAAVVPLTTQGRILGALLVAREEGDPALFAADLDALRSLAAYAAIAIENAELHERAGTLVDQMRGRLDLLQALLDTGNRLRMELDLPALLQEISEAIRRSLGWKHVYLSVRTRDDRPFQALTGYDPEETKEILARTPTPLENLKELMREEFRIGSSYFIDHRHVEEMRSQMNFVGFSAPGERDPEHWNAEDALVVPIMLRGELLGYISPDEPADGRKPSLESVQALELFANQAAVAIDNARLFQEQKETADVLRARSEELERAYAELRASQERLLVSEKMAALGRVTAGIAHEINSPLGGILNSLQLAKSYVEEYESSISDPEVGEEDHRQIAEDLQETLRLAEAATRKVGQFVRSIKEQTRTDEGKQVRFDPAAEIESALHLLRHGFEERGIKLEVETQPGLALVGDPTRLSLVAQNLIANAADAYDSEGGTVRVRCRGENATVVLEVEDHGSGIPEEIRERIFDYLFTTKEVGRGTGLGLSMVHSIVTSHFGGTIEFRSEMGRGTTFAVLIPAA